MQTRPVDADRRESQQTVWVLALLVGLALALIGVDRLARALVFGDAARDVTQILIGSMCAAAGATILAILALARHLSHRADPEARRRQEAPGAVNRDPRSGG